jgi:hypothetical protein
MFLRLSLLVSCAALTMTAQELVQPALEGFKYPALARSARIQGPVQFVVSSNGIQVVSGHPLLAAAAKSNLEKWAIPYASDTPLSVTYSFRLTTDTGGQIAEVDEPIGDRFDRFFLRLFHRPVTRKIEEYSCIQPEYYQPVIKSEMEGGLQTIKIDVKAGNPCVTIDRVAVATLWH